MPNFVPLEISPTTADERDRNHNHATTATCRACGECVRHTRAKPLLLKAERQELLRALQTQCPRPQYCTPRPEVVPPAVLLWANPIAQPDRWLPLAFDGKQVMGQFGELSRGVVVAACLAEDTAEAIEARGRVVGLLRAAGYPVRTCGLKPNHAAAVERPLAKPTRKPRRKAAGK